MEICGEATRRKIVSTLIAKQTATLDERICKSALEKVQPREGVYSKYRDMRNSDDFDFWIILVASLGASLRSGGVEK